MRPLGSQDMVKVDVRLVAATNRDLEELVRDGEVPGGPVLPTGGAADLHLPPLRERREDIPALVDRFLAELTREGAATTRTRVSAATRCRHSMRHRWPGNVRELQNEIRRAAILADGVILLSHLSEHVREPRPVEGPEGGVVPAERGTTLPDLVRELEVREIENAMQQSNGNKSRTAEMLGVSRFALQRKLEKYEIDLDAGSSRASGSDADGGGDSGSDGSDESS